MIILSRPRRAPRAHEWTPGKAVTFIVTLAATRSVTLAARQAGMSRKSAYALKSRDRAFADAWETALNARPKSRKSDEVEDVQASPNSLSQGDSAIRAARSTSSTARRRPDRRQEEAARDLFFARLAANRLRPPSTAAGLLPSAEALSLEPRRGRAGWQA
jgi:hypothetical protein